MTTEEVFEILAVLKARYGDKIKVNAPTAAAWSMVLDDVTKADAMAMLPGWMKHEEWPPDPAQVRNTVLDSATALPTVDEAWRMVMDRIRDTYPGRPAPDWDAPTTVQDALKDIGGTWAVRQAAQTADMEKRFRAAYGERRQREMRLTALPGGVKEIAP